MIHFFKTIFPTVILILFPSVEISTGYTDQDVKLFNAAQSGNLEKILKDWHDSNLEQMLK